MNHDIPQDRIECKVTIHFKKPERLSQEQCASLLQRAAGAVWHAMNVDVVTAEISNVAFAKYVEPGGIVYLVDRRESK